MKYMCPLEQHEIIQGRIKPAASWPHAWNMVLIIGTKVDWICLWSFRLAPTGLPSCIEWVTDWMIGWMNERISVITSQTYSLFRRESRCTSRAIAWGRAQESAPQESCESNGRPHTVGHHGGLQVRRNDWGRRGGCLEIGCHPETGPLLHERSRPDDVFLRNSAERHCGKGSWGEAEIPPQAASRFSDGEG